MTLINGPLQDRISSTVESPPSDANIPEDEDHQHSVHADPSTNIESHDEEDESVRIMNDRCRPCKSRGRHSKCNRVWPACSKCIRSGSTAKCFPHYCHQDGTVFRPTSPNPNPHDQAPQPIPDLPRIPHLLRRAASAAPVLQHTQLDWRSASPPAPPPHTPRNLGRTRSPPPLRGQLDAALIKIQLDRVSFLEQELAKAKAAVQQNPMPQLAHTSHPPTGPSPSGILPQSNQSPLAPLPLCLPTTSAVTLQHPQGDNPIQALPITLPHAPGVHPQGITYPTTAPHPIAATMATLPHDPNAAHALLPGTHLNPLAPRPPPSTPASIPNFITNSIYAGDQFADRKRPSIIPGLVGSREFAFIPDAVRRLFSGTSAWSTHVSLWYFTDEYSSGSTKLAEVHDTVILNRDTGALESRRGELPKIDESSLTAEQWIRAWQRLSGFLYAINHPDATRWSEHYNSIMRESDFFSAFPKWRLYCTEVRKRALQQGIDPSHRQWEILNSATADHMKQIYMSDARRLIAEEFVRRDKPTTPQSNNTSSLPRTLRNSHHGPTKTSGPSNKSTLPLKKCFLCGSRAHTSLQCHVTRLISGNPMIASKSNSGTWTIAAPHPMPHNNVQLDLRRTPTLLIPDTWEQAIRSANLWDHFSDVPTGLKLGFRLGVTSNLTSTTVHKNHSSATQNPSAVINHIQAELSEGHYSGPFSLSNLQSLIGHFRASPLGVVDKSSSPGSFRIIQDFSFPRDHNSPVRSVNSEINPENFQCDWSFFNDVVETVLSLPPGTQAATFNVDAAYRRMPIHPDDQPHLIIHWDGQFYVDHCAPFGATSSNGIFGRCGNCMKRLLLFHNIGPVLKWVDDFCIFRTPIPSISSSSHANPTFNYDEDTIYAFASNLGWPWKISKTCPFNNIFTFLGFEWNISQRSVALTPKKREKFLSKINNWLSTTSNNLKDSESLLGSLIHCALAIPEGKSRVVGLARFIASFPHSHATRFLTRKPTHRAIEDVHWWKNRLSNDWCGSFFSLPPPQLEHDFYMDASTSFGIGVVSNGSYGMWKLSNGAFRAGRDIGWAEIVAVELSTDILIAHGFHNISIRFWSDNQGIVGALQAGRSRNDQQNLVLQRIIHKQSTHNIHIYCNYIQSTQNPADNPSRGIPPQAHHAFQGPLSIDSSLRGFLAPVPGHSPTPLEFYSV